VFSVIKKISDESAKVLFRFFGISLCLFTALLVSDGPSVASAESIIRSTTIDTTEAIVDSVANDTIRLELVSDGPSVASAESIIRSTTIDTTEAIVDSVANDTIRLEPVVPDSSQQNILRSIINAIPDTVVGVPTNYVPNKIFGTLESLAKDTFAIDTSKAIHYRALTMLRRVYGQLYITIEQTTSIGVTSISDPERIIKLKDYFSENGRKTGWHPLLDFTSETRVKIGAKIFYRRSGAGAAFRWLYTSEEKWLTKAYMTHQWVVDKDIHQISATIERRMDDDLFYYGHGADPHDNNKSHFLSGAKSDRGHFHHDILRAQAILGVRKSAKMSYRLSLILTERRIIEPEINDESKFSHVFDVTNLPGGRKKGRNFYNEFAVNYDSRSQLEGVSRGLMAEAYFGLGVGIGSADRTSFLRYGFETIRSIPTFSERRQIVTKLAVNMVENLDKKQELKFYDYPRHPAFRGVSTRYLLRSDKIVAVPSIELDQPIMKRIMGTAFFDYLVVGPTAKDMGWSLGEWATGMKVTYHNRYSELGSILFAYGPEGVRLSASLGTQRNRNERSRWH